jgi:hypothetical protein
MNPATALAILKNGSAFTLLSYIVWQVVGSLPMIEKEVASVRAETAVIQTQHMDIKSSLQKSEERREKIDEIMIKLTRGTCMGLHKTLEAQQKFCNP